MKILKFIFKEIVYPASFLFTLYVFGVYLIATLVNNLVDGVAVHPLVLLSGYAYLLVICAAAKIFKTEIKMIYKLIVSYLSFSLPIIIILSIASKVRSGGDVSPMSPSTIIILLAVISVIYAVFATPVLVVRAFLNRKKNSEEKYVSQFNKV